MKLQIGSLFSGIGGLERGLEMTHGFVTRWQVEVDPFCRQVLRKHWPLARRRKDVAHFPHKPYHAWECDILTGGFPCQPVSNAGKRKGKDDKRWLWTEMLRVCSILRPRWVLAENVPGLLSADDGRLFGTVVADLASCGYRIEWRCVQAADVGASQIRERLFILAYAAGEGLDGDFCILGGQDGQRPCVRTRWCPEPRVDRVANGIPSRVYKPRLRGLGNAVVPQVAYWIGKRILEADKWLNETSGANGSPNGSPTLPSGREH